MNLTFKNDALKVLGTTKPYVESPKYVQIDYMALDGLAQKVKDRIDATLPERDEEFLVSVIIKKIFKLFFLKM